MHPVDAIDGSWCESWKFCVNMCDLVWFQYKRHFKQGPGVPNMFKWISLKCHSTFVCHFDRVQSFVPANGSMFSSLPNDNDYVNDNYDEEKMSTMFFSQKRPQSIWHQQNVALHSVMENSKSCGLLNAQKLFQMPFFSFLLSPKAQNLLVESSRKWKEKKLTLSSFESEFDENKKSSTERNLFTISMRNVVDDWIWFLQDIFILF